MRVSRARKSTLSTRSVKRDSIKMHVGITRYAGSVKECTCFGWGTHYSDEEVRRAVVVQLVLEEGDLGVEENRVWARELSDGDRMQRVGGFPRSPLCTSKARVV